MGVSGTQDEHRPREFGRDGISGLVTNERAMRARDVSRPRLEDEAAAERRATEAIARAAQRRR